MPPSTHAAICVMGVSGSGKSSVGEGIAESLGLRFLEGDRLHPPANVEKMSKGIPLTDEDRWPWLDAIGAEVTGSLDTGQGIVLSCSALKKTYRDRLRAAAHGRLVFVYLHGSRALLEKRMGARSGHFMPASLLDSQLKTLESPVGEAGVVTVEIDATVGDIVRRAIAALDAAEKIALAPGKPDNYTGV